jgi:hypothetical protein
VTQPKLASFPKENDGDGRYYKNPVTGEKLPSITSILRLTDKSGLVQYAADGVMLWAVDHIEELMSMSPEAGFKRGRFRHKDRTDLRAEVGNGVHETIEMLHTGGWDFPELDYEQRQIMKHWEGLNEEHEIIPVLSEFTVWNPGITAGTGDGCWLIDGVQTLVDIKTSARVRDEHYYQLAALWKAPILMDEYELDKWREVDPPQYDRVAIVHLRDNLHEIHYVDDLDLHWDAFKGYADVWKAKAETKARQKERENAAAGF